MKKSPKTVLDSKDAEGLDPNEIPDPETAIMTIWHQLKAAQEGMREPFPSHWDAFWYGTFSCLFTQMVSQLGEKEAVKIVGKKAWKGFVERHDVLLEQMFDACHRFDECEGACDDECDCGCSEG